MPKKKFSDNHRYDRLEDVVYFVSDNHRYGRLEDALNDSSQRSLETQKHTSVLVYATTRQAAYNFGGEAAARQFDLNLEHAPNNPLAGINVMCRMSLWG